MKHCSTSSTDTSSATSSPDAHIYTKIDTRTDNFCHRYTWDRTPWSLTRRVICEHVDSFVGSFWDSFLFIIYFQWAWRHDKSYATVLANIASWQQQVQGPIWVFFFFGNKQPVALHRPEDVLITADCPLPRTFECWALWLPVLMTKHEFMYLSMIRFRVKQSVSPWKVIGF